METPYSRKLLRSRAPERPYLRVRQARILEAMEASDCVAFRCWGRFQLKESGVGYGGASFGFWLLDFEAQELEFGVQVLVLLGFRIFGWRCWVLGLSHSFRFGRFNGIPTSGQISQV